MNTPRTTTPAPEETPAPAQRDQPPAASAPEPLTWYQAVDLMQPHIVKLSTPTGQGTGFLVSIGDATDMYAIATAAHVVDHAHYWEQPIRVDHVSSGKTRLVRHTERALFLDSSHDTAAILITRGDIPFPDATLSLTPRGKFFRVGNDIGWLGFPAVAPTSMCFFGGRISAWNNDAKAYLVDGVAINGVSGGPAFVPTGPLPMVIGVVTAYMPNRATGDVLPGLSLVRDVTQFHELAAQFASMSEAKAKESPATPPPPPPSDKSDKVETRK